MENAKTGSLLSSDRADGPLRISLLNVLILFSSFAALAGMIRTDDTVTITTTVSVPATCPQMPLIYLQALEALLLVVLVVAALLAVFLVRLYRRTKF